MFVVTSAMFLSTSSFTTFPSLFPVLHTPFFGSCVPAFPPLSVFIPVSLPFPSCPVFLHLAIGYPPVPGWYPAIVRRQLQKRPRDPFRGKIGPRTIIRSSPEPVTFVGAIPVALIEENIHCNVGNHVNIGSRYDNDRRR